MLKPSSPVKPLLAAIVVASGTHYATANEANSALLFNSLLYSAKTDSVNTIDSLQLDTKAITQSQYRRLEKAWQLVIQQLHQTANSSRWGTIMYRSFGVDLTASETLRQSWARNNFADLPAVEIADLSKVVMLSNSHNKRAIAAYSSVDNRIYLSQQLLDNATARQLAKVWLEEIGHSIDNRFNQVDTVGDEGAIFAKLITDSNTKSLEQDLELQVMQASNDHALLPVENQYRPVELATIEVGATCTLNDAITSANDDTATNGCTAGSGADEITFNATTDGTLITMTAEGVISTDLTITGNGMSPTTVIQAAANNRHFQIAATSAATIANLSLTGGSGADGGPMGGMSGGSIRGNSGSTLNLNQVEIANSSSTSNGGAIYAGDSSHLSISNSYLHNNTAADNSRGGGAISTFDTDVFISGSLIANNNASNGSGGGIFAYSYDHAVSLNIVNSTFYNNTASDYGGNIGSKSGYSDSRFSTYLNINIVNSTISHGSASTGDNIGAYLGAYKSIELTVLNTILANAASGDDCRLTGSERDFTLINSLAENNCRNHTATTNLLTGDPALGALADNGGPLPTMALQAGSPAIDMGTTHRLSPTFSEVSFGIDLNGDGDATDTGLTIADIAYDARGTGFARVLGTAIDLGAFESSDSTPAPTIPLRWDIDDNGISEMNDGSLVLRYLYGFRGDVLIDNAIGTGASLTTAVDIEGAIQALVDDSTLDIDDNNNENTFDGSLLLRYLLGYRGQTLINGAVGQGANRSSSTAIQAYIELPD